MSNETLSLAPSRELAAPSAAAARPRSRTLIVGAVILVALTVGALAWANRPGRASASEGLILHEVKRQDLDILVTERGALESSKNTDIACEVEARTPGAFATVIIWIEKEGTEVQKGDKLVELDSASLRDQITQQQIKVEQARAALTKAETDLEITRSQNESDIKKAEIDRQLAEIDLKKYLEGDYVKERNTDQGKILIAEEQLKRAEERFKDSVRLGKKGYVSSSEVDADRLSVLQAKNDLAMGNEELRVLDKYSKNRSEKDFTSKRDEATRALDRVQNQAKAKEAQAEAAMLAQKLTTETEVKTLEKLEKQLQKCTLFSPTEGRVV